MSALGAISLWLCLAMQGAPSLPTLRAAPRGPSITVRGTSRLELEKIEPVQGGVMITVRLQDGELAEPIPDRSITVVIRQDGREVFRTTRQTTPKGSAQIFVPHQKGDHEISLGFGGDSLYVAAAPSTARVDLSKEAVQLQLTAPPRVEVGAGSLRVLISARQQGPIAYLPLSLQVRREKKRVLTRTGSTDADGQLRLELPTQALGSAGEVLLEAQSEATPQYNAARTSQRLFLVSSTTTTLRFARARGRRDSKLQGRGEVKDASGPVPGGTVRLLAFGRTLITVRTDREGQFSATLPLGQLPLGTVSVTAEFVPGTAWLRPSRSQPALLTVEPHRPIPVTYYLVPALLTLLFLLGVLLARRQPWRRWKALWRGRLSPPPQDRGGIELGRRRSLRGLFGVDQHSVRGTVLDLHLGTALGGAAVYLRRRGDDTTALQTHSAGDGTFALAEASEGSWELLVTFPGHLPQSLSVSLPHRGELHGVLVRLQSVRHRVMEVYAAVMAPRLPDPALVRFWTPAEAAAHVRASPRLAPAAVEALSDLASEVYYGPHTPATEAATEAESLASQAQAPVPPVDPRPDGETDS